MSYLTCQLKNGFKCLLKRYSVASEQKTLPSLVWEEQVPLAVMNKDPNEPIFGICFIVTADCRAVVKERQAESRAFILIIPCTDPISNQYTLSSRHM